MGRVSGVLKAMGFHLAQDQKRQILALDEEFSAMETQITTLNAENLDLRAQVKPLEREVERLKKQVEQKKAPAHALEQTEVDMLKALSSVRGGLTSPQFAQRLGLHPARVEHFLHLLLEKDLILAILAMGGHARYELSHNGNAYLVKNGLV
jgi:hypothetical protein